MGNVGTEKFGRPRGRDIDIWNDAYNLIVSLGKSSAIDFMRSLACGKYPVFSPIRVQKFFAEAGKLMKSRSQISAQRARICGDIRWIQSVVRKEISPKASYIRFVALEVPIYFRDGESTILRRTNGSTS